MKIKIGQTWETRGAGRVDVLSYDKWLNRFMVGNYMHQYAVTADGCALFNHPKGDLIAHVERVYIAGPMTGYPDLNFPAFHAAAFDYRNRGCHVENPAEINGGDAEIAAWELMDDEQRQEHYAACIRKDITHLITCETIVLLPGWENSRGAKLEYHTASMLGLSVVYAPGAWTGKVVTYYPPER